MRRWLIAIFAVHFLLNVGFFAFGKIDTVGAQAAGDSAVSSPFAGSNHPVQIEGLMGVAPDHALTDGQADLPEVLVASVALISGQATTLHPAPPPFVKLIFPANDGPRRPPRHATLPV